MLDLFRTSPLTAAVPFRNERISVTEHAEFSILQVAGFGKNFEKSLAASVGNLPADVGVSLTHGANTIMRIAPRQFWVISPEDDPLSLAPSECLSTPLTSSRTRIAVSGDYARECLAKCSAMDFHSTSFKPDQFALTGIHHMPVLTHCAEIETFHIYVMRTFALHMWEIIVDAAHSGP